MKLIYNSCIAVLILTFGVVNATLLRTNTAIRGQAVEGEYSDKYQNPRPLIGVITEPSSNGKQVIEGSYVKFIEQAGARVVAIRSSGTAEDIVERLQYLNGLFLPGGGTGIKPNRSQYYNATRTAVQYALATIESGESFPIWGTCLGWEELAEMMSNDDGSVLDDSGEFDSSDQGLPLRMTDYARQESLMFSTLPNNVLEAIQREPLTFNSHSQGVTPEQFKKHNRLATYFHMLATGNDRNGREFVAAVEARHHRGVFAVQFHPEKSQFEWYHKLKELRHDAEIVYLSQHFANLFMSFARKSRRTAPTSLVNKWTVELDSSKRIVGGENTYFFETYEFDS